MTAKTEERITYPIMLDNGMAHLILPNPLTQRDVDRLAKMVRALAIVEDRETLPTIAEALAFRIEQYGHTLRDASMKMGINETHLSELRSGKINASRAMQWKLYQYGIPPIVLIQPFRKPVTPELLKGEA